MRLQALLRLRQEEFIILIQQAVQVLQDLRTSQVQLIQYHPITLTDSLHQQSLLESDAPIHGVVRTQVLLQLSVLVVVYAVATLTHEVGNESHH